MTKFGTPMQLGKMRRPGRHQHRWGRWFNYPSGTGAYRTCRIKSCTARQDGPPVQEGIFK